MQTIVEAAASDRSAPGRNRLGAGTTDAGEGEPARIVKLCRNLFPEDITRSLAEITFLAQQSGAGCRALPDCLNNSVTGSTFTRYKTPAFVNLDFRPTFTAALLRKDFDLGPAAAREREVPLPVAALVHQIVQTLIGYGYSDQDFAGLIELEARSAGLPLASGQTDISDGLGPADNNGTNGVR